MVRIVLTMVGLVGFLAAQNVAQGQTRVGHVWLDGVVAIVGARSMRPDAHLILHSDVDFLAALLADGDDPTARERVWRVVLDELVGEGLIIREARRVGIDQPSAADRRNAKEQFIRRGGGEARLVQVLQDLYIGPEELAAAIERRATVAHFLRVNLEDTDRVSDAAVRARYDQGDHPFVDQPFATAGPTLRLWMRQRALTRAVEKWVGVLRARDVVHIVRTMAADRPR